MPVILIVDDNLPVLDLLEKVLALERYEVLQACDGYRALDILRGRAVDLVITDIDMPGMGGIDLLKKIREEGLSVPVVAMSGDFEARIAIQEGFEAFICKPFKIDTVLEIAADTLNNHKKKILIVDDMADMRSVVRTVIEKLGFRSIEAGDGAEAMEVLERERVDLIISDCSMPFLNGRDLIAEVKSRFPGIPVIVASANFKAEDVEILRPFGFLRKPFRLDDLRQLVLKAMS